MIPLISVTWTVFFRSKKMYVKHFSSSTNELFPTSSSGVERSIQFPLAKDLTIKSVLPYANSKSNESFN